MLKIKVYKRKLKNGLYVLVVPKFQIPKVTTQLWYNVGSTQESKSERGFAHLVEHMLFKGTKKLSETDIFAISSKLGGYCNAFTSRDYTGYFFDFPIHQWHHSLSILSDTMINCTFKKEHLKSEISAVIQELKMYKDDYLHVILEKLIRNIFEDHPYRHPVIGYKRDILSTNRENLINFYKNNYAPDNAHLVISGAVKAKEAFEIAEKAFGKISVSKNQDIKYGFHEKDILEKSITIYRDLSQSHVVLAWEIPGFNSRIDYLLNVLSRLIGSGRSSRLRRLLIDKKKVVNHVESFIYSLKEYGIFVVYFQPNSESDIQKIIEMITNEIDSIAEGKYSIREFERACKRGYMDFLSMVENQEKCAYFIGKNFSVDQNENYISEYFNLDKKYLPGKINDFISNFLRPNIAHKGIISPISRREKKFWIEQQKLIDFEDDQIISKLQRKKAKPEPTKLAQKISVSTLPEFKFPKPKRILLNNGLKIIYFHSPFIPKIDLIFKFKAYWIHEPEACLGVLNFLMKMIQEGTQKHPGSSFMDKLESMGISLGVFPGQITMSMLSENALDGLQLLKELLMEAQLPKNSMEKIRSQILSKITNFWDTPAMFIDQIARETIYGKHYNSRHYLGTHETVKEMTHQDIKKAYRKYISPVDSRLILVGDLEHIFDKCNIDEDLTNLFGLWEGKKIEDPTLEKIKLPVSKSVFHPINRDQTVLAFAGLSIKRKDPNFDKILLFDQALTGSALGSMSSRLFSIREQTGVFYSISGSLLFNSSKEPGMIYIKTLVSLDQIFKAEKLIMKVLEKGASDLKEEELLNAKIALESALVNNFSENGSIASALLFLEEFGLPPDFFDKRARSLSEITVQEVKSAVKEFIQVQKISKIYVGRARNWKLSSNKKKTKK